MNTAAALGGAEVGDAGDGQGQSLRLAPSGGAAGLLAQFSCRVARQLLEANMTITTLKPRTADVAIGVLPATGPTSRAHKACLQYRRHQSPVSELVALAALNALPKQSLTLVKQAAGI